MAFLSKKEKKAQKRAAAAAGNPAVNLPVANNSIDPGQPVGDNTRAGESTKQPQDEAQGQIEQRVVGPAQQPEGPLPPLPASFTATPDSSQIEEYGYNAESRALFIRFKSGARPLWCYRNVDEKLYGHFVAAASKGSFFLKTIKPNHPAVFINNR